MGNDRPVSSILLHVEPAELLQSGRFPADERFSGQAAFAHVGSACRRVRDWIPCVTVTPQPSAATHVRLLAGHAGAGHPVFEVLPARSLDVGVFELVGSPGMVLGCAAGDVLRVGEDGRFEMVQQGANLCVQAYRPGRFTPESFADLEAKVAALDGSAEAPPDLRFIVVTLNRATRLSTIEATMNAWTENTDGAEWWFGTEDRAALDNAPTRA